MSSTSLIALTGVLVLCLAVVAQIAPLIAAVAGKRARAAAHPGARRRAPATTRAP